MAILQWNQVGERTYEAGIDRGVLYGLPPYETWFSPWNGLISVDETVNRESKPFYMDGVKYLDVQVPGEYAAKITAYTYPPELERFMGDHSAGAGLIVHDQRAIPFGLSYRTRVGDDQLGLDAGYKIHLLYSVKATPEGVSRSTLNANSDPIEFAWNLTSTPQTVTDRRPTAHLSLDSRQFDPELLTIIESLLYGSNEADPRLVEYDELVTIIDGFG